MAITTKWEENFESSENTNDSISRESYNKVEINIEALDNLNILNKQKMIDFLKSKGQFNSLNRVFNSFFFKGD